MFTVLQDCMFPEKAWLLVTYVVKLGSSIFYKILYRRSVNKGKLMGFNFFEESLSGAVAVFQQISSPSQTSLFSCAKPNRWIKCMKTATFDLIRCSRMN